ncbi:MAG: hypothetical protein WC057_05650 [Dehalococcoidales bacterium]|jgi:hypothetical protein
MSLQITKDSGSVYDPVFLKILEDIPGGVTVKTDRFPDGITELKKGALLNADASSAGLYNVIKTARLTATPSGGTTVLAIEPEDHLFKVGEFIYLYGTTASTITRVSATAIAVAHTLVATGGAVSGGVLYETATIATATPMHSADAILRNNIKVRDDEGNLLDNLFAGAVVRGTVDESELPYFVTTAQKTSLTDRIRFA